MNSSRYYSLVAARALSAGRPLDQALEEAARIAPPAPPAVRAAIVHLKAGRLKNALEALRHVGVDPLLAQAGEICPKATSAVRTRLDTLPDAMVLSLPFRGMAVYLAIVFFIQASMGALLSRKVVPAILHMVPGDAGALSLAITAALAFFVVACTLILPAGADLALRGAWRASRSAAVHAAAAGLAAAGVPGDAQRLLALHPEIGRTPAQALTASTLDEISGQLAIRATRSAARMALSLKLVGTALALLCAALIAGTVYLMISRLTLGGLLS